MNGNELLERGLNCGIVLRQIEDELDWQENRKRSMSAKSRILWDKRACLFDSLPYNWVLEERDYQNQAAPQKYK